MKILVTNDDGYRAEGLHTLVEMMKGFGEITVIAPKYHQSSVAIGLTMGFQPMAVRELGTVDGVRWIYLDGTPASCVKFAIDEVFTDGKPDFVVSGINHGSNAATAACYSATLGAAMEAAINGIPAVGISLDNMSPAADFSACAELLPALIAKVMALPFERGAFYNVNVPDIPAASIKGVRVGTMGYGHWAKEFVPWTREWFAEKGIDLTGHKLDPSAVQAEEGETLYRMAGYFVDDDDRALADHHLISEGYITVTKHIFDNTDQKSIPALQSSFNEDFKAK